MKKIWTILTVGILMLGLPLTVITCRTNDNLYRKQKDTLALAVQKITNIVERYQEIETDNNKVTLSEGKTYAINTIYKTLGGDNNIYGVTPSNFNVTSVLDRDGRIIDEHNFSVGIVFEVKYDINNSFEFLTNQSFWLFLKYLAPDDIIKTNLVFTTSSAFQITNTSILGLGSQSAVAIEKQWQAITQQTKHYCSEIVILLIIKTYYNLVVWYDQKTLIKFQIIQCELMLFNIIRIRNNYIWQYKMLKMVN